MKRVLRVAAVIWAVLLVGWAIARAQGWVGEGRFAGTAEDLVEPAPRLMPATKSDAGEGARVRVEEKRVEPARRAADEELNSYLGGTKAAPVLLPPDPPPAKKTVQKQAAPAEEDPALLPATKSDMMNGIGGLQPARGTPMCQGRSLAECGLGGPGASTPPNAPARQEQQQPQEQK